MILNLKRRIAEGEFTTQKYELKDVKNQKAAGWSVIIFILATIGIILFGSIESIRPVFNGQSLSMAYIIEILMLSAAAIILLATRTDGIKAVQGSVFSAGMQAVVAIFGIAWMGDTFIGGNMAELKGSIEQIVTAMPWLFRDCPVPDVYLIIQPGCDRSCFASFRVSAGDLSVYADRPLPCRERILFHPELSDSRGCDQFRPYGNYAYW